MRVQLATKRQEMLPTFYILHSTQSKTHTDDLFQLRVRRFTQIIRETFLSDLVALFIFLDTFKN